MDKSERKMYRAIKQMKQEQHLLGKLLKEAAYRNGRKN